MRLEKVDPVQPNQKHQRGLQYFREGAHALASELLGQALLESQSSELWNDWATVQATTGRMDEAKKGYRRALELDPKHCQSAANLGVLLLSEGKIDQAVPLLEQSLQGLDKKQRKAVRALLKEHRAVGLKKAVGA
jgi:Tfp pilus assembly protein PilF